MKRLLLPLAFLLLVGFSRTDGSQDAALYVAPENGLPTIQSAVNAVMSHDSPHTIKLAARITYTESVSINSGECYSHNSDRVADVTGDVCAITEYSR